MEKKETTTKYLYRVVLYGKTNKPLYVATGDPKNIYDEYKDYDIESVVKVGAVAVL